MTGEGGVDGLREPFLSRLQQAVGEQPHVLVAASECVA
jgi:hypothetical protein